MNSNEKPTMDAKTLLVAGQVVMQVAAEMKMDEVSVDYRDGYADAGKIMMSYGMLLSLGFSMEELEGIAKKKLAINEQSKVDELKKLLGDD
jgi:hypothetical protein